MEGQPENRLTAKEALRAKWIGVYASTVSDILDYNTSRYVEAY
jgi:hypothetical protein